jgi:general secretion pathway protein F
VTLRQRIRFYQQFAVLARAGLPIRATVDRLRERVGGTELAVVAERLTAGDRLAESFAAAGFLSFETNLVAAGERSGHLDTIFERLGQFWQREWEFRQALLRPLYYPVLVMNLGILLGAGVDLLTYSPAVAILHLVVNFVILYAVGIGLYFAFKIGWTKPAFKRIWLFVPLIGRALSTGYAYRWITTLRLEFGAGISLYRAVGDAWRASGFIDGEGRAQAAEEAMRGGLNLSALVHGWREFPPEWADFIETGEVSGGFDAAFTGLEEEAAIAWRTAHQRMAEWLPRILYFVALLVVASQVIGVAKRVMIDPISQLESKIDNNSL